MIDLNSPLPAPAPSVVFKPLPDGGVLFSTDTEVYFGVNLIGARIWELLPPASKTFGELCAALSAQYSDVSSAQIQKDVQKYLDSLTENGLVVSGASERT